MNETMTPLAHELCEMDNEGDLSWHMATHERFALAKLLDYLRPNLAIEVGTLHGGSLQVLSRFSKKVISIDLDKVELPELTNVTFLTGDSAKLLPKAIAEASKPLGLLGFVLIDADHTAAGVARDIVAVLKVVPRIPITILMHDSFNPACRQGILSVPWAEYPLVNYVDLDFVAGRHYDPPVNGCSMWGGFALATLSPIPREGPLVVQQSQKFVFESVKFAAQHL